MTNDAAIEEQHGHLEPVSTLKSGVGIDVDDGNGRYGAGRFQGSQLDEHVVTEVAAVAAHDDEAGRQRFRGHARRGGGVLIPAYLRRGCGASPRPSAAAEPFDAFTCFAISSTVFIGTSPTAVTW